MQLPSSAFTRARQAAATAFSRGPEVPVALLAGRGRRVRDADGRDRRRALAAGAPDQRQVRPSAALTSRSRRYFVIASVSTSCLRSPCLTSCASTASVIDSASTWKNRRAAGRVSEKPHPSVPSDVNGAETHLAI